MIPTCFVSLVNGQPVMELLKMGRRLRFSIAAAANPNQPNRPRSRSGCALAASQRQASFQASGTSQR